MVTEYSDLPISLLRQYCFCQRIPFLILVRGLTPPRGAWVSRGIDFHMAMNKLMKRRDLSRFGLTPPYTLESEKNVYAPLLGIHGICDCLITDANNNLFPVELKMKEHSDVSRAEQIQLTAYGLALEEMTGQSITHGFILHGKNCKSITIPFTHSLRMAVNQTILSIKRDANIGLLPHSCSNEKKCSQCEFLNFCADRL